MLAVNVTVAPISFVSGNREFGFISRRRLHSEWPSLVSFDSQFYREQEQLAATF